jgi:hypothetical protein
MKMKEEYISELPAVLFCALVIKAAIVSPSGYDVLLLLGLGVFAFGIHYMKRHKKYKDFEKEVTEKYLDITHTVNKQNEVIKKVAEETASIKTTVSTVKMSQGFKNTFNQPKE